MRLFNIRKTKINDALRETFEQYGTVSMQVILGTTNAFKHKGKDVFVTDNDVHGPLLLWLTEQYDRVERKENWSLLMEIAITFLVLVEVILEF